MAQKSHRLSNIDEFVMERTEVGTDGIRSGMNGVGPRNSEARRVAGLAG